MITVAHNDLVHRWSPTASFIAVWTKERVDEQVPDHMIEIPDWIVRSQIDRDLLVKLISLGVLTV